MATADDLTVRPVTEDEFAAWTRAISLAFGEQDDDEKKLERWRRKWGDLSRTIGAFDGDRIVGNAGDWDFTMSLPDRDPVPCSGLTVVGVAHDWRRRGVLSRMMRFHLDRLREEGRQPFAALYASESPIYGRFGYGIAAPSSHYRIDREWARLAPPGEAAAVRLVDPEAAIERWPTVYEAARTGRGGMMSRDEIWWRNWLAFDDPGDREGYSPRFLAEVEGRGYVAYRVKPDWGEQGAEGKLLVIELIATDPAAEAALWQFVFGVDLVARIESHMQPVDGSLPLRLAYRGRLRERLWEGLWLRLVDVGGALVSRGYRDDGRVTFDVRDAFCPWNEGTWSLEVADGKAACERTHDAPDLVLDVADLAAISLGGVRPTQLVWAGRIEERRDGAAREAGRLFAVDRAPWNPFEF